MARGNRSACRLVTVSGRRIGQARVRRHLQHRQPRLVSGEKRVGLSSIPHAVHQGLPPLLPVLRG
eukprot:12517053-Alexandrium_andersonii.AAC.1